jgi:hypothetical protein
MPSKEELVLLHDEYIQSIKNNIAKIGEALSTGPAPSKKSLFTPEAVEILAAHGLGIGNIAGLYAQSSAEISRNPVMLAAFERGQAKISSIVRASIVDDAINKDLPYAKLHLDKVFNKDDNSQNINLNVTQTPLQNITDDQLLSIDLDEPTKN